MPKVAWGSKVNLGGGAGASVLLAAASYALLLKTTALALPDPRTLVAVAAKPGLWHQQAGFHVSWFGALLVAAVMAVTLNGIRGWLVGRIARTGFPWPNLAGGIIAVVLILLVSSGLLGEQTFLVHGVLGWLVTPAIVTLGTFAFDRYCAALLSRIGNGMSAVQRQAKAVRQSARAPQNEIP